MKNAIKTSFTFLVSLVSFSIFGQELEIVEVSKFDEKILIKYNFELLSGSFRTSLFYSVDGMNSWMEAKQVSGDVEGEIIAGEYKQIIWNALRERGSLNEVVYFKVSADISPPIASAEKKNDNPIIRSGQGQSSYGKVKTNAESGQTRLSYNDGFMDAKKYYKGYRGAGTVSYFSGFFGVGLYPIALPIIFSFTKAGNADRFMPEKSQIGYHPEYQNGFRAGANRIKRGKVWSNFGYGAATFISLIVVLAVTSGS